MKNIILQHWAGPINELTKLSSANISKYATKVNADYELILGHPFRSYLSAPCQKMYMLDERFDEYDDVVMMDADMFTRKGMCDNVFDPSITGIGMHTRYQSEIFKGLLKQCPSLTNSKYAYWGGAIYKIDRNTRQKFRSLIREDDLKIIGKTTYEDEAIMHRLASLAEIKQIALPGDNKWCCGNFERALNDAALIHIRHKVKSGDGQFIKKPKIEVYRELVSQGLIEE